MTYQEAVEFVNWCNEHRRWVVDKEQWPKYNQAIKIIKERNE